MLFNSPEFLFAFLPIALIGYFALGRLNRPAWPIWWLIAASLFYYGWWRVDFVPLIVTSIVFNYLVAGWISKSRSRTLMLLGVSANVLALVWFKYSGFLAEIVNDATQLAIPVPHVVLPLAISFYTFQQIAYLVDCYSDGTHEHSFSRYALFILFFPQLIAGPIVHHREMLPQFAHPQACRPDMTNLVGGLTLFTIGLFKKVCIADTIAAQTDLAFGPAAAGIAPNLVDSWMGAVAYSLQMYFDFSGYSDMAIGLALMFGIRLPINFNSPFKAASIIEYWSRWHMTLTRFLTSYIYTPIAMGLTRKRLAKGKPVFKRNDPEVEPFLTLVAFPVLTTMTIAGVWHGAGWTFLVFGVLHGFYLAVNHAWRAFRQAYGWQRSMGPAGHALGVLITFVAATVALVFFKADTVGQALAVLQGMAGLGSGSATTGMATTSGFTGATQGLLDQLRLRLLSYEGLREVAALAIVWLLPNSLQYVNAITQTVKDHAGRAQDALCDGRLLGFLRPKASFIQGSALGVLLTIALIRAISVAPSEFLYFTF